MNSWIDRLLDLGLDADVSIWTLCLNTGYGDVNRIILKGRTGHGYCGYQNGNGRTCDVYADGNGCGCGEIGYYGALNGDGLGPSQI